MKSKNNKPNLYLITNDYPYGDGENSFINPELPYLMEKFDVTIISHSFSDTLTEKLDDRIKVIHYNRNVSIWWKIWDTLHYLFCRGTRNELIDIFKSKGKKIQKLKDSILFYEEARRFKRYLIKNRIIKENEKSIIYCYWYTYYCLSVTELFENNDLIKVITRSHRYDLYDEGYLGNRQPYKKYMEKGLDALVFISEHGRKYYAEHYNNGYISDKYRLFRLGVKHESVNNVVDKTNDYFLLVSCSLIIPRKRIELIIEALSLIDDIKIKWIHFGDGFEREKIENLAQQLLGDKSNIEFIFKGFVETKDILNFYESNYVDAFITTTESEGCPVSVQEAMAYGIPIIGTAVAEIPYMIRGNGYLLSENPRTEEIARSIVEFFDSREMDNIRKKSYHLWKKFFDSDKNNSEFIKFLKNIVY